MRRAVASSEEMIRWTGSSSAVTSYRMQARCRCASDTNLLVSTRNRRPSANWYSIARSRAAFCMSSERRKLRTSVVSQVIGSSSTRRRMVVPSGAGRIVWPAVAKPYALSGYTIGQVSWKPFSSVAGW